MRTVIDNANFLPQDVRPVELLAQYKSLVERDVKALLAGKANLRQASCPGCNSAAFTPAFSRYGLDYSECNDCGTLWIRNRPSPEDVRAFYRTSDAERFWQTHLAKATAKARIAHIIEPRLDWMIDSIQEHRPDAASIADVGTQLEAFAERFLALKRPSRKIMIEPLAAAPKAGVEVIDAPLETLGWQDAVDVITLFDVLDRTGDTEALVAASHRALIPGGLAFFTGILSSGFDIQVMWDKAQNIFPPDRLNVFSVSGLQSLLRRQGFDIIEFSTPGAFDLKAIESAQKSDPGLVLPRFVTTLLRHRENEHSQFQSYLQSALLSSFGRVLARKRA